jgi:membrane protease YdiL (CAAX protease family)
MSDLIYRGITFPIAIVSIIVDIYLWINGVALFGASFVNYIPAIQIYLVLIVLLIPLSLYKNTFPIMKLGIAETIIFFVPAFLITAVIFGALEHPNILNSTTLSYNEIIVSILFEIFVVAFTEEMFFRGVIQGILENYKIPFPYIWQGILFGLFHYEAYSTVSGTSYGAMFVAMIFGIAMGVIVYIMQLWEHSNYGIAITWGIHSAWNLVLTVGLLSIGGII